MVKVYKHLTGKKFPKSRDLQTVEDQIQNDSAGRNYLNDQIDSNKFVDNQYSTGRNEQNESISHEKLEWRKIQFTIWLKSDKKWKVWIIVNNLLI